MKKGSICIGDTGAIISLAIIDKLSLLDLFFDKIFVPQAVWSELVEDESFAEVENIKFFFRDRVKKIHSVNDLKLIMDRGESEAVLLYQELEADVLLIDDRKAREIAESLGVNCLGTLALLITAKENQLIESLNIIFSQFLANRRFYSKQLLNSILRDHNEQVL